MFKQSLKNYFFLLFLTLISFISCKKEPLVQKSGNTETSVNTKRIYYLAAEEVEWNYLPEGKNVFTGMEFTMMDSMYAVNANGQIGPRYRKAVYREYTDSSFTTVRNRGKEWEHLGLLGPVIRGNVGDSIIVVLKNKATINVSFHVHGLLYNKSSEGAAYNDSSDVAGDVIAPGKKYTYRYFVRDSAGPTNTSSTVWLYHSHVNMNESDVNAGLMGAIIISKKEKSDNTARPLDIDKEFITMFMVIDENVSQYLPYNQSIYAPSSDVNNEMFREGNRKYAINGYLMGNIPGLNMKKGEKVRWYVLALGNMDDWHTPHWHGNTFIVNNEPNDVVELGPASMKTVDMIPDNPGVWAYHCHVNYHMMAGMTALYEVE